MLDLRVGLCCFYGFCLRVVRLRWVGFCVDLQCLGRVFLLVVNSVDLYDFI